MKLKDSITKEMENVIPVEELVVGGVYKTHVKDLILIKDINVEKNEMTVYNITESCTVKYHNLQKHSIIQRIR